MTAPTLEAERAAPCPFCRSDKAHIFEPDGGGYAVLCYNCTAEGPLHVTSTDAIAAWNRRAAPVAEGVAPMCERKTNDIMQRDGYAKTGYVLKKEGARICVSDGGAVAWFTNDEWNWLMFNRDHVEFNWPKPIAYIDGRTAGAAPDDVVEGLCNTLGEIDALACDGLMPRRSQAEMRMRFKQIINQARPAMLAAASSQMDKGREGGNG